MSDAQTVHVATIDEDSLDNLERRLAIAIAKLTSGASRGKQGETPALHERSELKQIADEIVENARAGVRIAPFAESRPLIPLFRTAGIPLPPEIKIDHEQMHYNFYAVQTVFSILLPKDQFPLFSEFEIDVIDDMQDVARKTRPIRLFPGKKDVQFFQTDLEGAVGIDANMNISTLTPGLPLPSFLEANANARLKAGVVVGPFQFSFRKAAIEVKGESDQHIFWRYNLHSEIAGTNDFKSVLILKVAEETRSITMNASLRIAPARRRWLLFKDILPVLKDHITLPVEIVKRKEGR